MIMFHGRAEINFRAPIIYCREKHECKADGVPKAFGIRISIPTSRDNTAIGLRNK